jgi:HAMP domain-containing protein
MILAALVSALLVGSFNYFASRSFLNTTIEAGLGDLAAARAARIELGIESLLASNGALAFDPAVADALVDLSQGFEATDSVLDDEQAAELRDAYRQGIDLVTPPGTEAPAVDSLFPASDRAQYLQYWYLRAAPVNERSGILDPGDGSPYTDAHVRQHPVLRDLAEAVGGGDMLLIDPTGAIVYSVQKNADFATNLLTGPYRDSTLAEAVRSLELVAADQAVIVDFEPYLPAGGSPQLWVTSLVRDGNTTVGALATPIPNSALVDITTAGGDWEALGLGETGEVYIVGPDRLMRSEARPWLEDPEGYIDALEGEGYSPEVIDAVTALDTTVLVQPVDTDPVEAALDGGVFDGATRNYLGTRTLAHAEPLDAGSLGWVVVTEAAVSEIYAPLRQYLLRLALLALVLVPVVIVIATILARRILRPIDPIIEAAGVVESGDLDVSLPAAGRDEFAKLSSEFNEFVAELVRQRKAVASAEEETSELLESVVPRQLVDQVMAGERDIVVAMRNATLIVMSLRSTQDGPTAVTDLADRNVGISAGVSALASRFGAQQLTSSATELVFATGLDSEGPEIEKAVDFAVAVRDWVDQIAADTQEPITCALGLASGDVAAGLIGTDRMTFDVLGGARRTAVGLAEAASSGSVLVDAAIAARLGGARETTHVVGLSDASGSPLDGWEIAGQPETART